MLTMPICAGAPSLWVPGAIWVASARVRPPQPPKKWALLWLNPLKVNGIRTGIGVTPGVLAIVIWIFSA